MVAARYLMDRSRYLNENAKVNEDREKVVGKKKPKRKRKTG